MTSFFRIYLANNAKRLYNSATGELLLTILITIVIISIHPFIAYFGYYSNLYHPFLNHTLCKSQSVIEKYYLENITDPRRMKDFHYCCFEKQPPYHFFCFVDGMLNILLVLFSLTVIGLIIIGSAYFIYYLISLCHSAIKEQFTIYQETLTEVAVIKHQD